MIAPTLIVPTLCVGMLFWTLCVRAQGVTRSVLGCIPTQSELTPQSWTIFYLCLSGLNSVFNRTQAV